MTAWRWRAVVASIGTYILHDYLQVHGGAERLVLTLARGLPNARLAVSAMYNEFRCCANIDDLDIQILSEHGWLPRQLRALIAFSSNRFGTCPNPPRSVLYSGVFAPLAVRFQRGGKRTCYCHTLPRFAFDRIDEYLSRVPFPFRRGLRVAIARYRSAYIDALRAMDRIITNSRHVQAQLQRATGLRSDVVYPPVDTSKFRWKGQGKYYLSVGRLEPNKRIDVIVRAFRTMPDLELVVASGGSQLRNLRRLAAGCSNIRFTGWTSDRELAELVGDAIGCIYIPRDEDFGMSAIESLAAGKPVIGTDEGGLKEIIIPDENGLFLPPEPTPQLVAEAVRTLTPAAAFRMREACTQRALAFSSDRFVSAMSSALQ